MLVDPILGSNHGRVSWILVLITGDNVEFNLCAHHGLHELVKGWLQDSDLNYIFTGLYRQRMTNVSKPKTVISLTISLS